MKATNNKVWIKKHSGMSSKSFSMKTKINLNNVRINKIEDIGLVKAIHDEDKNEYVAEKLFMEFLYKRIS